MAMLRPQSSVVPSERGLTLIELVVTLALTGLIFALAGAVLFDTRGWLAHQRLAAAARELYYRMQSVRLYAVRDNHDWAIVFLPGENRYLICSDPGADHSWSNHADNTVIEAVDLSAYQGDVSFGSGGANKAITGSSTFPADWVSFNQNTLKFDPQGTPSASGYCYLANPRGESRCVGALTSGLVKIAFWNQDRWDY